MIAIGQGPEGRIDVRDEGLRHVVLERPGHLLQGPPRLRRPQRPPRQVRLGLAGPPRIAVRHDNDHRLALPLGVQVVEDEVRAALPGPARLVLAASVLQVEDRIARPRLRVVVRRRVDEGMTPAPRHLGVVPDLTDLAVRHVLDRIVVRARFRNFNRARPAVAAEVSAAPGIGDVGPVDDEHVVVEAGSQRRRREGPEPVGLLHHVRLGAAPEVDPHLGGVGSLHAQLDA
jgi:hypothetical protein